MRRGGWVYILTDRYRGSLYTRVTADLSRRIWEHREGVGSRHVVRRKLRKLVWSERHEDIREAIAREKSIKRWPREYKFNVIEEMNPHWIDLYAELNA